MQGGSDETATRPAEAKSIREQSKKPKGDQGQSRDIVKAVLASPLTTTWPNIPKHLQAGVLKSLTKLVPDTVADYHVSRARCHAKEKRSLRKLKKRNEGLAVKHEGSVDKMDFEPGPSNSLPEDNAPIGQMETPGKESGNALSTKQSSSRPIKPEILDHLVIGINETIKYLEKSIEDLRIRLMLMAEALNATHAAKVQSSRTPKLLPTAPRNIDEDESSGESEPGSSDSSPLLFIVIPLLSISPTALVAPIPQYCATYNSLVWQWSQLAKIVRARLKSDAQVVIGVAREEVRVVPLGDVEAEMAAVVGLRRVASLGVKRSHPEIQLFHQLLPKSVLHPPRHALTLPYSTSMLKVHHSSEDISKKSKADSTDLRKANEENNANPGGPKDVMSNSHQGGNNPNADISHAPLPHVHYTPLHIKGITTSTPSNGQAKKQTRLIEVRRRRLEVKERKKLEREGKVKIKSRKGKPKPLIGRWKEKAEKAKAKAKEHPVMASEEMEMNQ